MTDLEHVDVEVNERCTDADDCDCRVTVPVIKRQHILHFHQELQQKVAVADTHKQFFEHLAPATVILADEVVEAPH